MSAVPSARDIFGEALELEPVERAAFLDRVCAGQPELRARVERLLAAHADAGSFFADPTVVATPPTLGEAPGMRVGPYKLLELIGEGGFGAVFMAEQEEPIRRRVALKVIKLGMDTRQVIARFEAERQALALMDHPNIARVLDAGATAGGRPFFVMELVRGEPITRYCDRLRLTTGERLRLFLDVCHAVQHAHAKGVIHRDLKPGNVLVTEIDGRPVPKVIDFGIAKATGGAGAAGGRLTDKTVFTEFRQFIGTPEYMSPEQAAMSGVDVDTRSDVYSLGVLLYELLAGATPFEGERLRSAAFAEIQRIIAEEEPPKPSTRAASRLSEPGAPATGRGRDATASSRRTDPRSLARSLRGDLDWIAMKCLEKDRARRYGTAEALAADVARHLAHEPVVAGPPGAGYRLRKFVRRHRAGVTIAATIAVALLLALGVAAYGLVAARRSAAEAARHAEVADAVNQFLNRDVLRAIVPAGEHAGASGRDVKLREVLDGATRRIDAASAPGGRFADKPMVEAAIRLTLGESLRELGELDGAEPHLLAARTLSERVYGADDDRSLRAALSVAELRRDQGRFEESAQVARSVLDRRERAADPDSEIVAGARQCLALAYLRLERVAEAQPLFERLVEYYTRTKGAEDPDTLGAVNDLAEVYRYQRRFAEAEPLFRRLVETATRTLGDTHPDTLGYTNNLGAMLWDQARYDEAEPLMRRVLEGTREVHGPGHMETVRAMSNLANLNSVQGNKVGAESLRREAFEILGRTLGAEHPSTLLAATHLAGSLDDLDRLDEAEAMLASTLETQRRSLGVEHGYTRMTMSNLALLYQKTGRFDDAERLMVETLALDQRRHGPDHPSTLGAQTNLAMLYAATGQLDKARDLLVETLAVKRRALGLEHPFTRICMRNLAQVLDELGQRQEANALRDEIATWEAAQPRDPP